MRLLVRLTALLFFLAFGFSSFSQDCDCVTTGNCPVPVNDNGTYNGTLDVTVVGENDLGQSPLTSVCFTITHTWIGDLSVALTSPSGLNYMLMADVNNNYGGCGMQEDNIDVCIVVGDNNPLTNNTEYMCNSAPCAAGTCCLTGDWTVACGGVVDPINGATQAPNCNLNDFNIAGHPANGTWTLTVVDVCNMDTGTLDNFSLNFANGVESCIVCTADGGLLDSIEVVSCAGEDDLSFGFEPTYLGDIPDDDYTYGYVISQNGVVLEVDSVADFTNQPPGTYHVHGFSYLISDSLETSSIIGMDTSTVIGQLASTTSPFCADLSSNYIPVTILPAIPVTEINTTICEGECIEVGAQQVCSSDTITLTSVNGCDSIIHVAITNVVADVVIDAPPSPSVSCTDLSVVLDASNSIADVFAWTGPGGFVNGDATVTVTEPGTYVLTVSSTSIAPACMDVDSILVEDNRVFPEITVAGAAPQICNGDTFDLATLVVEDQNNTNAVITFHDGTPATPVNELNDLMVNPSVTTTYYILASNDLCTDEASVVLTVNDVVTTNFSVTPNICTTEESVISYLGNALPNSTYNWDFDGGVAVPGTGPGPHNVTWLAQGDYTVSLTIEENGCTSPLATQNVSVENPLPAPVISCDPTTSSITFSWEDVPGATDYEVSVLSSPNGNVGMPGVDPNTYTFINLVPGNSVTIEVVAVGAGICGNSSAELTCTASDCPDVDVMIDPVPVICFDNTTTPFYLTAQATGGTGIGDFIWSGDGTTITGNFNPAAVPFGTTTVTVDYYEGNCIYPGTTIDIEIYEKPQPAIFVPFYICAGEAVPVTFTGITAPNSTYTWGFGGGTVVSGSGEGPYEVVWPSGGEYDITVLVESPEGCFSDTLVRPTILVDPLADPDISCEVTSTTVTFSWPVDPNASSYTVNLPPGLIIQDQSTSTHQIFHIINLNPGDIVPIEVETIGAIPCGNNVFETSCQLPACPDVTLAIDAVADICRTADSMPFNLNVNLMGDDGTGTVTWNGPGVDLSGTFDPNQANIGANNITVVYEEGACVYTQFITINIFETPTAEFSADASVCAGDAVAITYTGTADPNLTYTWGFAGGNTATTTGPGPHDVSWPSGGTYTVSLLVENANGCVSEENTFDIFVETPIEQPVVSCDVTTSSIVFSWNTVAGVMDSSITVSTAQAGVLQGNTYTLNGLDPETSVDFELTLMGSGDCPSVVATAACVTDACPDVVLDILSVSDLCLGIDAPVQLTGNVAGSDGSGSGTWSGAGVNASTGMFDPSQAGQGTHTVTYTFEELDCSFETTTTINVYEPPVSSFSTDAVVCVNTSATIVFDGTAGNGATYTWDFNGGTVSSGSGAGPYTIEWGTPGLKNVTLEITDNGCASNQFQQQIEVEAEVEMPDVTCNSTTESVEFSWTNVTGASEYQVKIIGQGTNTTTVTMPTYFVGGLEPGESVTIEIIPVVNTVCDIVPTVVSCSADPCNDATLEIGTVDPICLMSETETIALQIDITGMAGTGSWSGTGIVDATAGVFDPKLAGQGLHTVVYTYQVNNCIYTDEIQIKVGLPPVADAGADATLSCWQNEQVAILGGNGTSVTPNAVLEWTTVDGDLAEQSTILHPQIDVPGTYVLTVTDVELNCSASDEVVVTMMQDIPVPSVVFFPSDCNSSNTTVAVEQVSGGVEPFLYSLNGEPYIEEDTFAFLPPGNYNLSILDAMGCENDISFDVDQSMGSIDVDLTANLVGRNVVKEGDTIQLLALSNYTLAQMDSVVWSNEDLLSCTYCLDPMAAPVEETIFTITTYMNGCAATDQLIVHVDYREPVYVPNAFSPNEDGVNDLFQVYAGPRVELIKTFMIFDRWGEMVYVQHDYDPNDPTIGWDGILDGKPMNPAVFVWYVEVELVDGSTRVVEGSVNLVR